MPAPFVFWRPPLRPARKKKRPRKPEGGSFECGSPVHGALNGYFFFLAGAFFAAFLAAFLVAFFIV